LQLITHHPFTSKADAIKNGTDIISTKRVVNQELKRQTVADTDTGTALKQKIRQLHQLLANYDE
jgi:fructose-1,6-bisphosphatase-3